MYTRGFWVHAIKWIYKCNKKHESLQRKTRKSSENLWVGPLWGMGIGFYNLPRHLVIQRHKQQPPWLHTFLEVSAWCPWCLAPRSYTIAASSQEHLTFNSATWDATCLWITVIQTSIFSRVSTRYLLRGWHDERDLLDTMSRKLTSRVSGPVNTSYPYVSATFY